MGLFVKSTKKMASSVYSSSKKYIAEKDGLVHTIVFKYTKVTSLSTGVLFQCMAEENITLQLNEMLVGLQNDGYEIIDIKLSENQKEYSVLILYK